ncbi:MAG: dihydrofolate reductase, partial [Bacteroidales bacterium]|nr:dihydrofolate reductase [Bacteroidales bacterium]
ESLPKGALPNRTNIVVTSDKEEHYPGCVVVRSLEQALARCNNEDTVFVIGGGQLYRATLPLAEILYLTRIHHTFDDADTFFPEINFDEWELTRQEKYETDQKHQHSYSFLTYIKIK